MAKALGFRVLENGTQLIGPVLHVAPEAYLFAPLSEQEILHLESGVLKRSVPAGDALAFAACASASRTAVLRSGNGAGPWRWRSPAAAALIATEPPRILPTPRPSLLVTRCGPLDKIAVRDGRLSGCSCGADRNNGCREFKCFHERMESPIAGALLPGLRRGLC
jgi:hypothetical protein